MNAAGNKRTNASRNVTPGAGADARADAAETLTRDVVLRLCASADEFASDWLADRGTGPKRSVPFPVPPVPGSAFAAAVTGAAAEMGADRLIACRTRAAFMYDPVTVLPARPQALLELLSRWRRPDHILVCLPDESAAVLVSAAGYAVGAGPPPFLSALAGPDVTGARERFTAWAQGRRSPRLHQVAARHGGSRHAGLRPPRHDFAERLQRLTLSATGRPGLLASLRFLRAAAGWEALAVIALTMLSAPRASGVLPVIGLACWLVFQVFALARTHTLSWAACLRMTAAGMVCAAGLSAAQRLALDHPAAAMAAWPGVTGRAWSAPVEELVKLVPLGMFCLLGRSRAGRLAAVDFLLLGVAAGAGFGLAEGTAAALTTPGTGWHLAALLPGWSDAGGTRFPGHAVTTGLAGAGIGLAVAAQGPRGRWWPRWSRAVWLLPPLLLGWAVLDHLAYDAAVSGWRIPAWAARLHAITGNGHDSRWLLLVLLAACVASDYRIRWRTADAVPPLPGVPLWAGLARTARGALIGARQRQAQAPAAPLEPALSRLRRAWAVLRLGAAEAVVEAGHELALIVAAARSRRNPHPPEGTRQSAAASDPEGAGHWEPGLLPAALAFARKRRELAMGTARAAGRRSSDVALRLALWPAWRQLAGTLSLGGFAAVAMPAVAVAMPAVARRVLWDLAVTRAGTWAPAAARPGRSLPRGASLQQFPVPAPRHLPAGQAIDLADRLGALHRWFSQFPPGGQWLIVAAGIGVLTLLVSGWALPDPARGAHGGAAVDAEPASHPAARPADALRTLTRGLTPARLPLAMFQLAGMLLPPAAGRLLAGKPVARPYLWQLRTGRRPSDHANDAGPR